MICRLPASAAAPAWAGVGELTSITRVGPELSVVCAAQEVGLEPGLKQERGWRVLRVNGPLAFDLVGVLASIVTPLARAGLPVFSISTFDTDYLMVRQTDLEPALAALREAGHDVETDAS